MDWLRNIKVADAFLSFIKKHWWIVLLFGGTNGGLLWHNHEQEVQIEAEKAASKIYAEIASQNVDNKPQFVDKPVVKKSFTSHSHADIWKAINELQGNH